MAKTLTLKAPAKLNLFLDILGLLPDGFHSLFMLMQTVSLCDDVTITLCNSGIKLTCSIQDLPIDSRNIAYRAAQAFFAEAEIKGGAEIHIEKRIPFEAGLGGGSADAAAVLLGLNQLHDNILPPLRLAKLALQLGSDVPFALTGGSAIALNKGEILAPLPPLPKRFCVIIKPNCGVSTPAAYKTYDELEVRWRPDIVALTAAASHADWAGICQCAANVFEQCVEVPNRAEYKAIMREHGAAMAQMTGSGSAVFGIFEDELNAKKAMATLKKADCTAEVFVCETL